MSIRYKRYILPAAVSLMTFAVYIPTLTNGFINWDDPIYVYENQHIRSLSWAFFKWAFTDLSAQFWHPVTWISYAVDYKLWGLNPFGYHLTAILLHAVNTFLVVVLTARLLEVFDHDSRFRIQDSTLIAAGVTGLLFGLHPLHVESVAWVSERKDLLCALFFLLSIISYISYRSHKTYSTYLLSLAFFIFALASKTMAVSLPVVLLILDWYPFKRINSRTELIDSVIEKMPFIVASLLISIISIIAQKLQVALRMLDPQPLQVRLLMAFKTLVLYLGKMIVPLHLVPFYPYPDNISLSSMEYLLPLALVAGTTIVCLSLFRKQQVWSAAWGYYVITLLPTLGIVQIGAHSMADRFTYLPSIGPFFLIGLVAASSCRKTGARFSGRFIIYIGAVLMSVVLSGLTLKQISIWKNSIVFWNYTLDKEPGRTAIAYFNRGVAFEENGDFEKALSDYRHTVAIDPNYGEAFYNLGALFVKMKRFDHAIENFSAALNLNPIPDVALKVYSRRGIAYAEKGDLNKALNDFDAAIGLKPFLANSFIDRGLIYQRMRQLDNAVKDFTAALNLNPDPEAACIAHSNRGSVYYETKQIGLAVEDFDKAIALNPRCAWAYNNRATAYEDGGEIDSAIDFYSKALSVKPDLAEALISRGRLYMKKGLTETAARDFQKACELGIADGCAKAGLKPASR
jgi:tetratricopeptide (TPR) repeat protein